MGWIDQDPNILELVREWEDKGRLKEARSLLYKVLALRSFRVTRDVRARIDREPDVARLEAWLEAAVTAGAIGHMFRGGGALPVRAAAPRGGRRRVRRAIPRQLTR